MSPHHCVPDRMYWKHNGRTCWYRHPSEKIENKYSWMYPHVRRRLVLPIKGKKIWNQSRVSKNQLLTCLNPRYIICNSRLLNLVNWHNVSNASGRKWMCGPSISSNSLSIWLKKERRIIRNQFVHIRFSYKDRNMNRRGPLCPSSFYVML